jgi:hypothetical protein
VVDHLPLLPRLQSRYISCFTTQTFLIFLKYPVILKMSFRLHVETPVKLPVPAQTNPNPEPVPPPTPAVTLQNQVSQLQAQLNQLQAQIKEKETEKTKPLPPLQRKISCGISYGVKK